MHTIYLYYKHYADHSDGHQCLILPVTKTNNQQVLEIKMQHSFIIWKCFLSAHEYVLIYFKNKAEFWPEWQSAVSPQLLLLECPFVLTPGSLLVLAVDLNELDESIVGGSWIGELSLELAPLLVASHWGLKVLKVLWWFPLSSHSSVPPVLLLLSWRYV